MTLKMRQARVMVIAIGAMLLGAACMSFLAPVSFPTAIIQVVDGQGRPVGGASVKPQGIRARGPYSAGWYSWDAKQSAPQQPVMTDAQGLARVSYPPYVLERLLTGIIILDVSHPNFVAQQIELPVNPPSLPVGAPPTVWIEFLKDRLLRRHETSAPKPIVLVKGSILRISARGGTGAPHGGALRALLNTAGSSENGFWTNLESDVLETRRLGAGSNTLQAVQIDSEGVVWFSDVKTISTVEGRTNDLTVDLKRGVTLTGQLDSSVPRPIKNGRVIVNISPPGIAYSSRPPVWHQWASMSEDGKFEVRNLPSGNLEVLAFCDGFLSTNGPGLYQFHYPQTNVLGAQDLSITVGMEPTASLEVRVLDGHEKPLKGAVVSLWPNARYGEWSAVVLGTDLYNTVDSLASNGLPQLNFKSPFIATTDVSGLAVVFNLPGGQDTFNIEHPKWELPPVADASGQQTRNQSVTLVGGETNRVSVRLESRHNSVISQY